MNVLKNDNITAFDCDGTLVLWPKDPHVARTGTIPFQYGGETIYLYPHLPHILFLKHCFNRGDYVTVWSKNGYAWAEQVALTLGIENYVNDVRAKPTRHVDDKSSLEEIVGGRIFMAYSPEE